MTDALTVNALSLNAVAKAMRDAGKLDGVVIVLVKDGSSVLGFANDGVTHEQKRLTALTHLGKALASHG